MSLEALRKGLRKRSPGVEAREDRGSLVLEGRVATWEERVALGYYAATAGYKGVVNDIVASEAEWAQAELPSSPFVPPPGERPLEGLSYDVVIIGGGVIGCAIARELCRHQLRILLLEKEEDVAVHTSSRNDGMIHDGFAAHPGSLKAAYNVLGNRLWEGLAAELGIEFRRPGSLLVFRNTAMAALYPVLAARAAKNGVDGWDFWSPRRLRAEEPNITDHQEGALFLPSAGILSPYRATVALAESAILNGARIELGACATGFEMDLKRITRVRTTRGDVSARLVVNAAGNWADHVAAWADDRFFSLHQRRGVDMVLDASTGASQSHILGMPQFTQAWSRSKGGGLVKTLEGNLIVGPTATEAPGRETYATSPGEQRLLERHLRINRALSTSQAITYFAGVRPCTWEEDFVLERSARVANLVHAAGIQSPGLASAPAIAIEIARLAVEALGEVMRVLPRADFRPLREAPPEPRRLGLEARAALVASRPSYGRIVCRCEEVSEGEIRAALVSALPASSLDAVKRRTRAGMGRCHGGFCTPKVMEILADELGLPLEEITKKGPGSPIVLGQTKARGGRP